MRRFESDLDRGGEGGRSVLGVSKRVGNEFKPVGGGGGVGWRAKVSQRQA